MPDLYLSESIEGSSNKKALEPYNDRGASVNFAALPTSIIPVEQATATLIAMAIGFRANSTALTITDDDSPTGTVRIYQIQAAAPRSPLDGQTGNPMSGIVRVVRSDNVYLQGPTPDRTAATSEAIFGFPTGERHDPLSIRRPGCLPFLASLAFSFP